MDIGLPQSVRNWELIFVPEMSETLFQSRISFLESTILCNKPSFRLEGSRCDQHALLVLECIREAMFPRGPLAHKTDSWSAGPSKGLPMWPAYT